MVSNRRVTRGVDYRRIVRSGYRVGGKYCLAHAVLLSLETDVSADVSRETSKIQARFGFIITKAVGKAVTRNLLRRRLKAICDKAIRNGFSGADVVLRVFPAAVNVSYQELEAEVLKQLEKVTERGRSA